MCYCEHMEPTAQIRSSDMTDGDALSENYTGPHFPVSVDKV